MRPLFALAALCFVVSFAQPQEPPAGQNDKSKSPHTDCPMHKVHVQAESDSATMNERGNKDMGFSQTKITHHFLLNANGGVIQVEANDPADTASRDNIRMHLSHIAKAFSIGDFAIPMFVHDTMPPGVPVMKEQSDKINYKFEETPAGGRVIIVTTDAKARDAIQQFLRFQIAEHKTGDSTVVH